MRHQFLDGRCQPRDRNVGGLELLPARESQQSTHQLGSLFRGMTRHADDLQALLVECAATFDKAQSPQHGRQQIVEIMGDAAGEFADRVHLLRLDKLTLEQAALRHVEQGSGDFPAAALGIAQRHRLFEEMLVTAIGALPAIFERQRSRIWNGLAGSDHACAVVGVQAIRPEVRLFTQRSEFIAGEMACSGSR